MVKKIRFAAAFAAIGWLALTVPALAQQGTCFFESLVNELPDNGEEVQTTTPTLMVDWANPPGELSCMHDYTEWEVATDEKFLQVVFNSEPDSVHLYELTVPSGVLLPGGHYYWRARPLTHEQDGAWSRTTWFSVATNGQPQEEHPVETFDINRPFEVRRSPILFPGARKPVIVSYAVQDGKAIFEGDILLGRVDTLEGGGGGLQSLAGEALSHDHPGHFHPEGIGIRPTAGNLWPGGVVPYVVEPGFSGDSLNYISQAIAQWEANTSIRLVPRTTESDYVAFEPGGGCASYVGRITGKQEITLAPGCTTGSVIHEIGHALGLFHEQSRCDRDTFVTIVWANIQPGMEFNFNNECATGSDLDGYDYGSIMHYPAKAFSVNNLPTIETVPMGTPIGNRNGLSAGDIAAIQALYGGGGPPPPPGNIAPTVTLSVEQQGGALLFKAAAQDPNGDPLTYEWFLNGAKQLVFDAQVLWSNPTQGSHSVNVKVSDGNGGIAQDTLTFNVTPGGGPPPPGPGLTIEDVIDANKNNLIDDDEILKAIEFWILGSEVPGTGQTITDVKVLALLRLWILGTPIK